MKFKNIRGYSNGKIKFKNIQDFRRPVRTLVELYDLSKYVTYIILNFNNRAFQQHFMYNKY